MLKTIPTIRRDARYLGFLALSATLLCAAIPSHAQDTPSTPADKTAAVEKAAANKATGLKIDAGLLLRSDPLKTEKRREYYYRFEYNGNVVSERGTAFTRPSFVSAIDVPPKPDGDSPDLLLRFENGAGSATGPLVDFFRTQILAPGPTKPQNNSTALKKLSGTEQYLRQIRGAAQVYGSFEERKLSTAVGLELPPAHPLRILGLPAKTKSGISNWIIPGIQMAAERRFDKATNTTDTTKAFAAPLTRQESEGTTSETTKTEDRLLFTYRSYIGRGFGFVTSQTVRDVQDLLKTGIARALNTPEKLKQARTGIPDIPDGLPQATVTAAEEVIRQEWEIGCRFAIHRPNDGEPVPTTPTSAFLGGVDANLWEIDEQALESLLTTPPPTSGDMQTLQHQVIAAIQNPGGPPTPTLRGKVNSVIARRLLRDSDPSALIALIEKAFNNGTNDEQATVATIKTLVDSKQMFDGEYANRLLLEMLFPTALRGVRSATFGTDNTVWVNKVQLLTDGLTLLRDRPRTTLALESIGQYISIGTPDRTRLRSLYGATLTFYLNPASTKRQWMRARYENGIDRAAPTVYRNQATFTLGFDL